MQPTHPRPGGRTRRAGRFLPGAIGLALCLIHPAPATAQPAVPDAWALPATLKPSTDGADGAVVLMAATGGFSVDTAHREEVRQFYRAVYSASAGVPTGWTGSYTSADPSIAAGTTSAAHKEAVLLRVNFFRALAGVPAGVSLDSVFSAKAQKAALMMSVNGALSHYPPPTWQLYSADGAEAAGRSNIALGMCGPDAIDGYVADPGTNNSVVGHRRWVLYPQTRTMGTGDLPGGSGHLASNALWVQDGYYGTTRPTVRDTFVAWPPEGYVPHTIVYPRWSFSYPGADFSTATVSMTRGGLAVPVQLEPVANGYGENTLVWIYDNLDARESTPHPRPASDTTYNVTVGNVRIGGQTRSFSYQVIVFDPDVAGADSIPVTVTGNAAPGVGTSNTYTVEGLQHASGFQWRLLTTTPHSSVEGAENGTAGMKVATTGTYSVVASDVRAAGNASFHLAHATTAAQSFQLAPTFLASAETQLTFRSRLGWATETQTARAQVSCDDGVSWTDVYTQSGPNGRGETAFTERAVPLASMAGKTFQVRFAYTFAGGSYYPGADSGLGWYVDEIAITGASVVQVESTSATLSGDQFNFTPGVEGDFSLQARGVFFDSFPLDWGPAGSITVSAAVAEAPVILAQPGSVHVRTGESVTFAAQARGTPAPALQWRHNDSDIEGANEATLTLAHANPADAGHYSLVARNSAGSATSVAAELTVSDPISITAHPASQLIGGGGSAVLSVAANGSNLRYQWYLGPSGDTRSPMNGATGPTFTTPALDAHATFWVRVSSPAESVDSAAAQISVLNEARTFFGSFGPGPAGSFSLVLRPDGTGNFFGGLPQIPATIDAEGFVVDTDGAFSFAASAALGVLSGQVSGGGVSGTLAKAGLSFSGAESASGSTAAVAGRYGGAIISTSDGRVRVVAGADGQAFVLAGTGPEASGALLPLAADGTISAVLPDGRGVELHVEASTGRLTGSTAVGGTSWAVAGIREGMSLPARLANMSVRAQVQLGDSLMIAGFFISGAGPKRILVRGIGPTLANWGVNSALGDPQLYLYQHGAPEGAPAVAQNDDWGNAGNFLALERAAGDLYAFDIPRSGKDAAVYLQLAGGAYTAHMVGASGGTGTALIELYDADGTSGTAGDARLINISLRGAVGTGNDIIIAGFVVQGAGPRRLLIRGVGPELATWGVSDALTDPALRLFRRSGTDELLIASNEDWSAGGQETIMSDMAVRTSAFPLTPGSKSAGLVIWLEPGVYTAQVQIGSGAAGVALVEVYEVP